MMNVLRTCGVVIFLVALTLFSVKSAVADQDAPDIEALLDAAGRVQRIYNGTEAQAGAYPWMVSFNYKASDQHFCGGSLIHSNWVLTAAHCVDPMQEGGNILSGDDFYVVAGLYDQKNIGTEGEKISVKSVIQHPQWDKNDNSSTNDIALIELATASTKVPVAFVKESGELTAAGKTANLIGWGVTETGSPSEILREVQLPIVTTETCQAAYEASYTIGDGMVCIGTAEGGKDSCQGDSGGPAVVYDGTKYQLFGVTSFGGQPGGPPCGGPDAYAVYTRVSAYTSFINQYVPDVSQCKVNPTGLSFSETRQAGTPVSATVTANNGCGGTTYYKFFYRANYGSNEYETTDWTVTKDYSTASQSDYTFTNQGSYIVVARSVADAHNEPAALPIIGAVVTMGNDSTVHITGFSTDADTITAGQAVTFTATASNARQDTIYYKFFYRADYGTANYESGQWVVVKDYSTENSASYTFPSAGSYIVVVRAVTDPANEPADLPIIGGAVNVQ